MAQEQDQQQEQAVPLQVDDALEHDSSYGDEIASSTQSLASSITNYQYENGRRYHAYRGRQYYAPNDEPESDRLDMHHHLATLLLGGRLHAAPIGQQPHRILDLGTGTGIWAIEMGDMYPSAEIIGVDLSPTQPSLVPPNVRFEVDDIEEPWLYSRPFDFIHSRFLAASIADWPELVRQTYQHLKPGGYVEFKDWYMGLRSVDDSLPVDSALKEHHELLCSAFEKIGRTPYPGPDLKKWVKDAGFVNVMEEVLPVPIGRWPKERKWKEIGLFNYTALVEGLEAISTRMFTTVLGWQLEEVQVLLAKVRQELKNRNMHAEYTYYVVCGQKPEDS